MIGATPATLTMSGWDHAERDTGGAAGIDRVAAGLEDLDPAVAAR